MKEKLSKDKPASVRTGNTGPAAAADSRQKTARQQKTDN